MPAQNDSPLDARYRRLLHYRAGFLPQARAAADAYLKTLKKNVADRARQGQPTVVSSSVVALAELIARDGIVRMYVDEMIRQVPAAHRTVDDTPELLATLDYITQTAPLFQQPDGSQIHFPMSTLFTYMMMTVAGKPRSATRRSTTRCAPSCASGAASSTAATASTCSTRRRPAGSHPPPTRPTSWTSS